MVMLTDKTGMLRGDESITVLGVNVAMQRETQRQRQLEFLQITANPIDMQIMGIRGRAKVLRAVADGIGLPGEDIVPPDDEIKAQLQGGGREVQVARRERRPGVDRGQHLARLPARHRDHKQTWSARRRGLVQVHRRIRRKGQVDEKT